MRFFLACILVILVTANVFPVMAQEINKMPEPTPGQINEALNNLTPVRFLPNNPLYFLIRGKEIIARFFQPSFRERAQFDYTISSKRLKEAYLLTDRGDLSKTGDELSSYAKTLRKIEGQLEKARSQNQDVIVIVDKISDNLRFQEVLLSTLSNVQGQDQVVFRDKLQEGLGSFGDLVLYLDKIKPGVRNRFKLFFKEDSSLKTPDNNIPVLNVSPTPTGDKLPRTIPRRIIY